MHEITFLSILYKIDRLDIDKMTERSYNNIKMTKWIYTEGD